MYQERNSSVAPGAVVWTQRWDTDAGADIRVLPDGCMDLIWTERGLLVAGPDTAAHLVPVRAGDAYAGVRFAPGTGPSVLGIAAWELRDRRVPLSELWPQRRERELAERIWGAADRTAELEAVAAGAVASARHGRIRQDRVPEAVLGGVWRRLTVREIADELALSERQLRRRCLDAFGYGPKTLDRVLRLARALDQARAGLPFAQVASLAGYADQSHLAREVRALAGISLGRLLAGDSAG
ncbi:helix-turn-helix transcriptional regulator [Streptomyces sioyaensis]|uniref:helix-turn-helix transcriptional regulator n=1 Tax=Streptomyces sioyaensis TaxID=67364 RepID=UPI00340F168A